MKKINWRYAFGEILIVIVGISIAFSLNKCSESNKNDHKREMYLNNLTIDIKADKADLESNLQALNEKIEKSGQLIGALSGEGPQRMTAMGLLFEIASISGFEPHNSTYLTMINSGDFQLIGDFELKSAIESHYSGYKIMQKAYARQENIHKEYLGNYLIKNTDYDAFSRGEFGFSDVRLLRNIVQSMNGSFRLKKEATQEGIESCSQLLDKLNSAH